MGYQTVNPFDNTVRARFQELTDEQARPGLIDVFNAEDGHGLGLTATTPAELADAIATARAHKGGPVLIECQVPNEDASPEVISWGSKVARVNARPPQNI